MTHSSPCAVCGREARGFSDLCAAHRDWKPCVECGEFAPDRHLNTRGACEQCEAFDVTALDALTDADCPNP